MKDIIIGAAIITALVFLATIAAPAQEVYTIDGRVLERGPGYAVVEGRAVAAVGGAIDGLLVVLDPDPASSPGPDDAYLGCGAGPTDVPGIASGGRALPGFRAIHLFSCRR